MSIIDTPDNTARKVAALRTAGVTCIIRYYNHKNTKTFPKKCLTVAEKNKIQGAGMQVAVVFQQRQDRIADFDRAKGRLAGIRAAQLAASLSQPHGSCIYFSADFDTDTEAKVKAVVDFFRGVKESFKAAGGGTSQFRVGAYGCGKMLTKLKNLGLATEFWVSLSTSHSGSDRFRRSIHWHLDQKETTTIAGVSCDINDANPALPDFGAF